MVCYSKLGSKSGGQTCIEKKMNVKKVYTIESPPVRLSREVTWRFCAINCCFYHHPMVGRKSDILASRNFNIKSSTVRG